MYAIVKYKGETIVPFKERTDASGWPNPMYNVFNLIYLTGAKRRENEGMIHFITIKYYPSNPQQPIHSLRKTHQ